MFGGALKCPGPPPPRQKVPLKQTDIWMPSCSPGFYAHRAREPNSNYHERLLHFKQRRAEMEKKLERPQCQEDEREIMMQKYSKHWENNDLKAKVLAKFNSKIAHYQEALDAKRVRLRLLLAAEEAHLVRETRDLYQEAQDNKLNLFKQRSEELKAAREAERQQIVQQKRIQQYGLRCHELRDLQSKKQTVESKMCQLQQMRENQARKESEKEIDRMWSDMIQRQDDARYEREVNEAIKKYKDCRETVEVLCKQMQAKKIMEIHRKELEAENRKVIEDYEQELKKQLLESRADKLEKRQKEAEFFKEQIELQKRFREQKKQEERALDDAFKALNELELQKERSKILGSKQQMQREFETYRQYLRVLERRRKEEDRKVERIIEEYSAETRRKADEKCCVARAAKQKLQDEVLAERAMQLELKKHKALEDLEMKKHETEMIRSIWEMNKKLNLESDRLKQLAIQEYRDDLKEQISYNHLLREKEMKEIEARLKKSLEEEQMYEAVVKEFLTTDEYWKQIGAHPFRKVMEQTHCCCPEKVQKSN